MKYETSHLPFLKLCFFNFLPILLVWNLIPKFFVTTRENLQQKIIITIAYILHNLIIGAIIFYSIYEIGVFYFLKFINKNYVRLNPYIHLVKVTSEQSRDVEDGNEISNSDSINVSKIIKSGFTFVDLTKDYKIVKINDLNSLTSYLDYFTKRDPLIVSEKYTVISTSLFDKMNHNIKLNNSSKNTNEEIVLYLMELLKNDNIVQIGNSFVAMTIDHYTKIYLNKNMAIKNLINNQEDDIILFEDYVVVKRTFYTKKLMTESQWALKYLNSRIQIKNSNDSITSLFLINYDEYEELAVLKNVLKNVIDNKMTKTSSNKKPIELLDDKQLYYIVHSDYFEDLKQGFELCEKIVLSMSNKTRFTMYQKNYYIVEENIINILNSNYKIPFPFSDNNGQRKIIWNESEYLKEAEYVNACRSIIGSVNKVFVDDNNNKKIVLNVNDHDILLNDQTNLLKILDKCLLVEKGSTDHVLLESAKSAKNIIISQEEYDRISLELTQEKDKNAKLVQENNEKKTLRTSCQEEIELKCKVIGKYLNIELNKDNFRNSQDLILRELLTRFLMNNNEAVSEASLNLEGLKNIKRIEDLINFVYFIVEEFKNKSVVAVQQSVSADIS